MQNRVQQKFTISDTISVILSNGDYGSVKYVTLNSNGIS